jgi:hypothetical protein
VRLHLFEAHLFERALGRGRRRLKAEVGRLDARAARHQHRALHGVIQLADVARPFVGGESIRGRLGKVDAVFAVSLGVLREEVARERGDVLAPLAQRRQPDFDRVEPEQ